MKTFKQYLQEAKISKISKQDAINKGYFGPVYHGTSEENKTKIENEGFKIFKGLPRGENVSNGYIYMEYHSGFAPPIHHLGYGVYFTTSKTVAKRYAGGTVKGLKEFYIKGKVEEINFGAAGTMMKWWLKNGYNPKPIADFRKMDKLVDQLRAQEKDWLRATNNLTNTLKKKWDAVWFKGKGMGTLLDGDQIVVFKTSNIVEIDSSLSKGFEVGSKVKRISDGMTGVVMDRRAADFKKTITFMKKRLTDQDVIDNPETLMMITDNVNRMQLAIDGNAEFYFDVKWKKGGRDGNVMKHEMELR